MRWCFSLRSIWKLYRDMSNKKHIHRVAWLKGMYWMNHFSYYVNSLVRILNMGHGYGMKNEHHILLMEKNHNLMVFKYKFVSKFVVTVVIFITTIYSIIIFFKLTRWHLEFEIYMLLLIGVDESVLLDKLVVYHMDCFLQ